MRSRAVDPSGGIRVEAEHLTFQYPEAPTPSLIDVSLRLQPRDRVLVIGANGSGKSTLLSLLAGQRKPQGNGVVRVMGCDPFQVTGMTQHIALIGSPWPPEAVFGNTVERVVSPAPDVERRDNIAKALHLRMSRQVDKMSSGEKRRVQVLHGLLPCATLFLLDECSTDIDVVERKTVLEMVKREVLSRDGCCVYATHVFDGVEDWATHVALLRQGRLVQYLPVSSIRLEMQVGHRHPTTDHFSLESYARQFMSTSCGTLEEPDGKSSPGYHYSTALQALNFLSMAYDSQSNASLVLPCDAAHPSAGTAVNSVRSAATGQNYWQTPPPVPPHYRTLVEQRAVAAVECAHLTYKEIFRDMSFSLPQGSRTLLCGCNGSGKSTLLNMLGGKQFFPNQNSALKVLGWSVYEDMRQLNGLVSFAGDWWVKTPEGEVYVYEMLSIHTSRARHLKELLAVDLNWDVRKISSGECKRVQLLVHLLEDKPVVLLDEATADLDVDQRHRLLHFLYAESVQRGVTVIYATHIFNGLEGWASKILVVDRTRGGVYGLWNSPTAVRQEAVQEPQGGEGALMEVPQIPLVLAKLKAEESF